MDSRRRATLRTALRDRYPWVADTELGPAAVEAGECDGCGREARLVATCGPGSTVYLGRTCLDAAGESAWCQGHGEAARRAMAWAGSLPVEADLVARVWWVATGEVLLDPALERSMTRLNLPGGIDHDG